MTTEQKNELLHEVTEALKEISEPIGGARLFRLRNKIQAIQIAENPSRHIVINIDRVLGPLVLGAKAEEGMEIFRDRLNKTMIDAIRDVGSVIDDKPTQPGPEAAPAKEEAESEGTGSTVTYRIESNFEEQVKPKLNELQRVVSAAMADLTSLPIIVKLTSDADSRPS